MSFLAPSPPRHKLAEIAHRRCDLARSPRFALLALGGFGFLLASLWRRALRRRGLPAAPLAPPAVRSAEKSRVASCAFADAVARLSIDTFRALCERAQVQYTQTCMAAVVALDSPPDGGTPRLTVLSVGAGTKFARAAAVAADRAGTSIRDCHAEAGGTWSLRPGVSLHLYTSSAPCGNASVRRWARCDG
ncbi:hypothetical protein EMIHUDRAFT_220031 [Emiliania huxleyi CCMP1516]|uniref:A to I editase domain-containing protein n=2 Tax=Emiliania huxleyi TaxID=2903 RepID=A0A0D3I2W6_EMIH1|nr:hypothetical protein EMIHUDRAFT_220031 [Emiliania huxleyi CCMP1516]EOD05601.1 hypothetical protein EMIHUDRAFT_220031 [Emiliania huxleyi CCMP1516]|eukprot:XP_005758030.1 hypothetical protein EMIHUDRAFT_220031 [Emiliania huxleyi CCMP1516]